MNKSLFLGMAAGVALLHAVACSGDVVTTTGDPGGGGTGGGEGGAGGGAGGAGGSGGAQPSPACESDSNHEGYEPFDCTLPAPCPEAFFMAEQGAGASGPAPAHYEDVAAAKCVLQKLRDREIAMLMLREDPGIGAIPGQFESTETIFVLDAEHAASNWFEAQDVTTTSGTRNRQILKPPSYFDACLAEQDETAIRDCIAAWSAGCADTAVGCP